MRDRIYKPESITKREAGHITHITANGNYSIIHWVNAAPKLECCTILRYEQALTNFIRVRKGELVNPKFVQSVNRYTDSVMLTTGQSIPIARRRAKEVVDKLNCVPTNLTT